MTIFRCEIGDETLRLPNWIWPTERNPETGFAVRLGRMLHWLFAISAGAFIAVALVMAISALASAAAAAQQAPAENASANGAEPNPFARFATNGSQQKIEDTGTIADTVESMPELRPVQPTRTPIEDSPKETVDWALLQASAAVFLAGLALALIGRGLRYVFANE